MSLTVTMRTLSARILLGFAALTLTFAGVTANIVFNLDKVGEQVRLMTEGYYKAALASAKLHTYQDQLHSNLDEWLQDDSPGPVPRSRLKRAHKKRNDQLAQMIGKLKGLEQEVEIAANHFASARPKMEALQQAVDATAPLYDKVLAIPGGTEQRNEIVATLQTLRTAETEILDKTQRLATELDRPLEPQTKKLLANADTVRKGTLYLGLTAVTLGLLITIWVVITLRPLGRLRDGARRVAAGDYASRIPEQGPSEVKDLAREYNAMARAVEERERELVRSERLAAVGKMAAMITHEVRNPLSSIGLNTELLEDELSNKPSTDEARELCHSIHREVDRLTAITEEYLAFARLPKPKLASESINTLVEALASFVREDLAAKQVSLITELASEDPLVMIDAGQIRQCLINLVRNATDAVEAKGGGQITVRTRTGNPVLIEVEDNGVGIPGEVLARLFDPFFSTKEGGNGLGLALTLQIVRDHSASLDVTSEVGRGTTFTLAVPRHTPGSLAIPQRA